MKIPYKSRNPAAGVANYEILDGAIVLEFAGGRHRYVYDRERPGPVHLEAMVRLAKHGKGLSTFVNQHVRDNYAVKIKINTDQDNKPAD